MTLCRTAQYRSSRFSKILRNNGELSQHGCIRESQGPGKRKTASELKRVSPVSTNMPIAQKKALRNALNGKVPKSIMYANKPSATAAHMAMNPSRTITRDDVSAV